MYSWDPVLCLHSALRPPLFQSGGVEAPALRQPSGPLGGLGHGLPLEVHRERLEELSRGVAWRSVGDHIERPFDGDALRNSRYAKPPTARADPASVGVPLRRG